MNIEKKIAALTAHFNTDNKHMTTISHGVPGGFAPDPSKIVKRLGQLRNSPHYQKTSSFFSSEDDFRGVGTAAGGTFGIVSALNALADEFKTRQASRQMWPMALVRDFRSLPSAKHTIPFAVAFGLLGGLGGNLLGRNIKAE